MYREIWGKCYSSICSISFNNAQGQRISSGTGFKVGPYLITNNHVFHAPGSSTVELRFVKNDGHSLNANKVISYSDFQNRLKSGSPESNWDYAMISLNDLEFSNIPSLELNHSNSISIGQRVAVLGFQFEQNHLSINQGILSSRYIRACVKYMQINASVNQGNSGGPLINPDNNTVVGIVTRKHTGLSEAFDDLIASFDDNIKVLSSAKAGIQIGGVDPVKMSLIVQQQMKITTNAIKRSANVGIGYAYELDEIIDFFNHL
jgi:S1-C subfamily serine protease